jgi:hypothetical protein
METGGHAATDGSDIEVVADANDPDGPRVAQGAILSARCDLQLFAVPIPVSSSLLHPGNSRISLVSRSAAGQRPAQRAPTAVTRPAAGPGDPSAVGGVQVDAGRDDLIDALQQRLAVVQ